MKNFAYFAAALLLCAFATSAMAVSFSATLTGAGEVPGPGDSDGAGIATITIEGSNVNYTIIVANIELSGLVAHIHRGAAGISGDVVVNLNPTFVGSSAVGTAAADPATISEILANPAGFYVNVHNSEFANGAVRGQLNGSGTTTYFPVSGNVPGSNGTQFVTDMRIVNLTSETAQVTIEMIASSLDGASGPIVSKTTSVPAGSQLTLDDVTGAFLGVPGELGALRVVSSTDIRVDIRVINDQRAVAAGTAGFSIEGLGFDGAEKDGVLPFLSQATDFRTNIGHFNPNASPIQVTFTAYGSDGTMLGTVTADVPAYRQLQLAAAALIPELAGQSIENFYVTYSSTAPVFVYGAVVDNVNGDSVYVK
jgi:hypothetical protein